MGWRFDVFSQDFIFMVGVSIHRQRGHAGQVLFLLVTMMGVTKLKLLI